MPTPPTETPGPRKPDVRRPAGVSRFGVLAGFVATAGTLAVAFLGLGGPPAPPAPLGLADATATATEPAVQQVVVKTVYVQLPSPSTAPAATPVAAPVAVAPQRVVKVVTRQSGAGGGEGGEGGEQEGDD
jgi:hypothetical protein